MAGVRRILKHVEVDLARGARCCRRNKDHTIAPGEMCLSIREDGLPFSKSYCKECSLAILKQSAADLRAIRDLMYPELMPRMTPTMEPSTSLGTTLTAANRSQRQAHAYPPMRIEVYEATPSEVVESMQPPRSRAKKRAA